MSEKYNIKDLFEEGGSIEMTTEGGVTILLTLDLLRKLIPKGFTDRDKKVPARDPNLAEIAMFANMILEDKLNPYKKECWCYWLAREYASVVSSAARMRKVMVQDDYNGWVWGWIGADGQRYDQGGTVSLDKIVGAWADVKREGKPDWHHEVFLVDYNKSKSMLLKVLRDQSHKFAFQDIMGNLSTENEAEFHEDSSEPDSANEAEPTIEDKIRADMGSKKVKSATVVDEKPKAIIEDTDNRLPVHPDDLASDEKPVILSEGHECELGGTPTDHIKKASPSTQNKKKASTLGEIPW